MAKLERRDVAKEAFWRGALAKFAASGLTIRAFCRREGLSESAFYFWRRELAVRQRQAMARTGEVSAPRPLRTGQNSRPSAAFVPAVIAAAPQPGAAPGVFEPATAASSLALEITDGCVLRFFGPTAVAQLAELVCHLQARREG